SGCLRPSRAIKAGNSASAPPPTDIRRGIVINAAIAASSLCRLFQAEAQNAAGLFARLDKLAAGRLAEMLEILGGAGIGREDFEDAAGGHGLQRAARLQDRQRAELIPGGWLTMPRIPDPPPEAAAPQPAAIRPIPPPRPKVTRPAVQRPPARPPSDGKVQF